MSVCFPIELLPFGGTRIVTAYHAILVLHNVKSRTVTCAFSNMFDAMLLPTCTLSCYIRQGKINIAKCLSFESLTPQTCIYFGVICIIISEESSVIICFLFLRIKKTLLLQRAIRAHCQVNSFAL